MRSLCMLTWVRWAQSADALREGKGMDGLRVHAAEGKAQKRQ